MREGIELRNQHSGYDSRRDICYIVDDTPSVRKARGIIV
jgi:hypothetical protein